MTFKEYVLNEAPQHMVIPIRYHGDKGTGNRLGGKYAEPKPFFKTFPIAKYDGSGHYYDIETKKVNDFKVYSSGYIDTMGNSPMFKTEDDELPVDVLKGKKLYLTNLAKPSVFKWIEGPEQFKGKFIVSIETNKSQHYYCKKVEFKNPVYLNVKKPTGIKSEEPLLRPQSFGNLKFGNIIGKVKFHSSKIIHSCYDTISIG
jgi:hypothetical protein